MKTFFFLLCLTGLSFMSCTTPDSAAPPIDSETQSPTPADLQGKWIYGTFSPTSFWGTDGSYQGNAYQQSVALDFQPNGTYEMYITNSSTAYNCTTVSYTYLKGNVIFNEREHSFMVTPTQGNYRGLYICAPSSNFKRDARPDELAKLKGDTYAYTLEKDSKGKPAIRLFIGSDKQGIQCSAGTW